MKDQSYAGECRKKGIIMLMKGKGTEFPPRHLIIYTSIHTSVVRSDQRDDTINLTKASIIPNKVNCSN